MIDLNSFTKDVKNQIKEAILKFHPSFSIEDVAINFKLRGSRAAIASCLTVNGVNTNYALNFNMFNLENDYDEMLNIVVPHEIAHLICFDKPELGHQHDDGWKSVCRTLGGTGNRMHTMQTKKARRTKSYLYILRGTEFHVSSLTHKKIQDDNHFLFVKINNINLPVSYKNFTGKYVLN